MTGYRTVLRCQVHSPKKGAPHGARLSILPFLCEPTYRTYKQVEDVPLGLIGAWCDKCKCASEYRVVAPVAEAA